MLWIKMYPAKCLRGNLRFDLPYKKRGIWYELLLMAGEMDGDGAINYPISFIASQMGCPVKVLEEVLDVLKKTDRITIVEGKIRIVNWARYQMEHQRYPSKPKKRYNAEWDAIPEEMKALYIAEFGQPDTWDNYTWIAVTGRLKDSTYEWIEKGIKEEKEAKA